MNQNCRICNHGRHNNWQRVKDHYTFLRENAMRIFAILLLSTLITSCAILSSVERASLALDRAADNLGSDSTKWRDTIEQGMKQLPKDIQSTVRVEVDNAISRAVAATGAEFRCDIDFIGKRLKRQIQIIAAALINKPLPALVPEFCSVTPHLINFNLAEERRQSVVFVGYDLDAVGSDGKRLAFQLGDDKSGRIVPIESDRVGTATHYMVTIRLTGEELESLIRQKNVTKLRSIWNGQALPVGEVLLVPRVPKKETKLVTIGAKTYVPPHVEGDGDFDTHDDEPMSYSVSGEIKFNDRKILVSVHMRAREERSDWTTVDGTSEWETAYTAPLGYRITTVTPIGSSSSNGNINSKGAHEYKLPAGEAVTRFEVFGDQDGNDAGTYTRVIVYFADVSVGLEEILGN